jgi:hypothetical protein
MESSEEFLESANSIFSEKNVPMFNILSLNQMTMTDSVYEYFITQNIGMLAKMN